MLCKTSQEPALLSGLEVSYVILQIYLDFHLLFFLNIPIFSTLIQFKSIKLVS